MKDDSGDLFRRGLWFAAGCAGLGAVLILRTLGTGFPDWMSWSLLLFAILIVPASFETGNFNVDLATGIISFVASVLGLLLFGVGFLLAGGLGDMLDLGPLFAFVGLATGVACNSLIFWDVFQDLAELAKQARGDAETLDGVGPTRACPQCGKKIPAYAGACRFCKCILQ